MMSHFLRVPFDPLKASYFTSYIVEAQTTITVVVKSGDGEYNL